MRRTEILISGFGGQGVVRLGQIFSTAAVREGIFTTMLVSHGTETRGGYVRSQVVVSGTPIDSPVVENPDYFCAMSSSAYTKFSGLVTAGTILYDPGYVQPDTTLTVRHLITPARQVAVEQLGREIFSNIIYLGRLGKIFASFISKESFLTALTAIVPQFPEENKKAFELGYQLDYR